MALESTMRQPWIPRRPGRVAALPRGNGPDMTDGAVSWLLGREIYSEGMRQGSSPRGHARRSAPVCRRSPRARFGTNRPGQRNLKHQPCEPRGSRFPAGSCALKHAETGIRKVVVDASSAGSAMSRLEAVTACAGSRGAPAVAPRRVPPRPHDENGPDVVTGRELGQ